MSEASRTVAIIGNGYVGQAFLNVFPDAYIYDEPKKIGTREEVNKCTMALVAVPTNLTETNELDTGIVDDVVSWLETELICIKSALMPGTADKLKAKYGKRIVVSPEYVGEGNYWLPAWKYPDPHNPVKHDFLIVGGEPKDRSEVAEFFWEKMSPDIHIHQVTALEAELIKMVENTWGGMKVVFANEVKSICDAFDGDFIQVIKGWGLDSRTDAMHTRTMKGKRGFKSKCYDKDLPALVEASRKVGYDPKFFNQAVQSNQEFNKLNEN